MILKIRFFLVAVLSGFSTLAHAEIISFDPVFEVIAAPASVEVNETESSSHIQIFKERSNFVTTVPFQINGRGPRMFNSFGAYQDELLPVGTMFDSYFVHVDSLGTSSVFLGPGDLTFSTPIIGIVGRDPHLILTSTLVGAPGTQYPTVGNSQHFDLSNNNNVFTLLPDGYSIRIQSQVGAQQDQLRILVTSSIPEPGAAGLVSLSTLMALLGVRRRRKSA